MYFILSFIVVVVVVVAIVACCCWWDLSLSSIFAISFCVCCTEGKFYSCTCVSVSVFVCIYIYMYVCVYIWVGVCVFMWICVFFSLSHLNLVNFGLNAAIFVCVWVCLCVCVVRYGNSFEPRRVEGFDLICLFSFIHCQSKWNQMESN